jgi:ferrochelatase
MSPTASPPVGVLVMAHGTPATPAGIAPFYTAIRRGRPPPPELLDELVGRYQAIGGTSPLTERTRAQVDGIAAALDAADPGRYLVAYGTKYATPSIEEGMATLVAGGVERVIGMVLTPHQSSLGSGEYLRRAAEAAASSKRPVALTTVPSWHRAPGFSELLADRTAATVASIDAGVRRSTSVFFTAHSLPLRVVGEGDPYPEQVAESAADVAALLRLDDETSLTWEVAWQSAGRTEDPWIGPDLLASIRRVADEGATTVVVCPVGFVSDHLEILYDLDIEAAGLAHSLGVAFARTPSLNDDPAFLAVLASVVRQADTDTGTADPGTLASARTVDPASTAGPEEPVDGVTPADSSPRA